MLHYLAISVYKVMQLKCVEKLNGDPAFIFIKNKSPIASLFCHLITENKQRKLVNIL